MRFWNKYPAEILSGVPVAIAARWFMAWPKGRATFFEGLIKNLNEPAVMGNDCQFSIENFKEIRLFKDLAVISMAVGTKTIQGKGHKCP